MKKRFYDILTIVYIILVIAIFIIADRIFMNTVVEKGLSGDFGTIFNPIYISHLIIYFLMGIYWLFILVLAAKLHRERLTKTVDLIIVILFVPLAPIFYLTNLRSSLNKYEKSKKS